jgi:plasmid stabilization system protein ParE
MVDRLTRRAGQIGQFPYSGRMVPEFGVFELREVIEGPFRIMYRIGTSGVEILAVLHGAREV